MFHGSLVALVTPMAEDGSIDYQALSDLIEWHIAQGTDGIVAIGTTGESATLTHSEHAKVLHHVVEAVKGRVPVIGGSGATSTQAAIELTKSAHAAGVDACLLMSPAYVKPTQEGLYQHYKLIANTVNIPQIIYNVPGRTASDVLPETIARLADIPNIIGVKEATGDITRVAKLLNLCGDKLDLYSGDDITAKDFILAGGKGVISVSANVVPKKMHTMAAAAIAGDKPTADKLDAELQPLHKVLFVEANPIPVKWAVHHLGLIPSGIRLPLTPLSEKLRPQVIQVLQTVCEA